MLLHVIDSGTQMSGRRFHAADNGSAQTHRFSEPVDNLKRCKRVRRKSRHAKKEANRPASAQTARVARIPPSNVPGAQNRMGKRDGIAVIQSPLHKAQKYFGSKGRHAFTHKTGEQEVLTSTSIPT
jgi:hypothetical protein